MSCWVAPSLAAELWHIPLEQVMRLIRDGKLPSREDQGFTFVDVAPAPQLKLPAMRRPEDRPTTFTPIVDEAVIDEDAVDDEPDTTESQTLGDWRAARMKASRTRIAPPRLISA